MTKFLKTLIISLLIVIFYNNLNAADLNEDLEHYFPMNGSPVDMVTGWAGDVTGDVTYEASVNECGQAAKFDGNSSILFDMDSLEEWTISFWFKVDEDIPTYWYCPLGKSVVDSPEEVGKYNFGFYHYRQGWLNSQYEAIDSEADHRLHTGGPLPFGQWIHITGVRKIDGTYQLYKNGILVNSGNGTDTPALTQQPLLIGGKTTPLTHMFKGSIDEIRIYSAGKDATFIKEIYEASESVQCEPIVTEVVRTVEVPVYVDTYAENASQLQAELTIAETRLTNTMVELDNAKSTISVQDSEIATLRSELARAKSDLSALQAIENAINSSKCEPEIIEVEVIKEVPVEVVREVVKEVIVEKEVIREVPSEPVEIIKEVPVEKIIEKPITNETVIKYVREQNDTALVQYFWTILAEHGDRKKNPVDSDHDGDHTNDQGNHYGNDREDNNGNDSKNKHN